MVTTVSFVRPTKAKANAGVCERRNETGEKEGGKGTRTGGI